MKKIIVFGLLLFGMLALSMSAFAYESATDYISFYSQCRGSRWDSSSTKAGKYTKSFWDIELEKRGVTINANGNYPYISNDGCRLLSFVHLSQYLTTKADGDTAQVDLLEKYARLANDPSTASAGSKYCDYLLKNYGQQYGITQVTSGKRSFDSWKAFFDDGGAAVANIPGHFFIVIGYAEYNGNQYIQAVDSSSGSTIKRLSNSTAYKFDSFASFKKTSGDGVAMQYWIPYSEFNSKCTIPYAFKSSMRKHQSTKLMYYESAKRSINEGSLADGTWSYEKPSYESKTVKYWKNGDIIDTIAIYEDNENRLWCELADHTFIEKDMEFDGTEWECCAFVESTATYWATGVNYSTTEGAPSGKLLPHDKLKNFGLRGTVYSSDSITDVIGYIYRADGSIAMQSNPMNLTGSATSVNIQTSNVNNNLSFSKLENGVYRYEVIVYTRHGFAKVIESVFGVGVEPEVPVTGLSFENGYTAISLNAATKEKFTLVPKYSPANTSETGVIWTSNDTSVATVSENGEVQAVAPGTATVTATSAVRGEISASCEVYVHSRITAFTLDREKVEISTENGITDFDLAAIVQPEGTECAFEWASANPEIATVGGTNGNICTVSLTGNTGSTLITARALDGSGLEKTCSVTVYDPSASSLKITSFAYPSTYKIDTTNGYNWSVSGSGTFSSNYDLTELQINIYYGSSGTKLSYTKAFDAGVKSISMNTKDSSGNTLGHYIKMSKVNTAGYARIEVIVSDASGARLSRSAAMKVVSSGSTVTSRIDAAYVAPTLVSETENNGHRYQLYKSTYTWDQASEFATSRGGHLATVSDAAENTVLKNLIQGISGSGAWLGGYYNGSGWNWVNGEAMTYTHWASNQPDLAMGIETKVCMQSDDGAWNDAMGNILNYFIVEVDSPIQSIAFTQEFVNLTRDRDYYGYPTYIEFTLRDGVNPDTVQYPKIIYSSADTSVAIVDENGVITPMCRGGQTVISAWPENDVGKITYLPVACFSVYQSQIDIYDDFGEFIAPGAVVIKKGSFLFPSITYWYDGHIIGDDRFILRSVSQGEWDYDVHGYEHTEEVVMARRDGQSFETVGSGFDIVYFRVEDENGDMIVYDDLMVYAYGDDEELRLPSGLKTVEEEAFKNTGACYLVVPAGVEKIEDSAFFGSEFDIVVFQGGNTEVGDGAFSNSAIFFCLQPGGKTEQMLQEYGMDCVNAVYVEASNPF